VYKGLAGGCSYVYIGRVRSDTMDTAAAIKAIRKALRRPGTKAEVDTRLGAWPTTKAAVAGLLKGDSLGELVHGSDNYWTFQREGEDFETSISDSYDTITVYAGS
jgi:hypothetical protein